MKRKNMTIDDMEAKARDAFDSICLVSIRGHVLRVERYLHGEQCETCYEYKWGLNKVSREVAINVLASREERKTRSTQRGREQWTALWRIVGDRAVGALYHGDRFVRDFDVAIKGGEFKPDIGTGSGVKIAFKAGDVK